MNFFSDRQAYGVNVLDQPRNLNRLNRRFEHIMLPNLQHIRGKRVLDLGAHDGHWSLAALELGAIHVTGIEGRGDLVARALEIYRARDVDPAHYDFIAGDMFDTLESLDGEFDTILCLGVFYHILDHHRLTQLMAAFRPEAIILDTMVIPDDNAFIQLLREDPDKPVNAIPRHTGQRQALIGRPSRGALTLLAQEMGYSLDLIPWDFDCIEDDTNITDYRDGTRLTATLRPLAAN